MPQFCDVALPVPLEATFTYRLDGDVPVIGGRVLVPFREKRLPGVVVGLHDNAPTMKAKLVLRVLDRAPLLDDQLLRLGRWLAQYYIAPLGEVLRTMLPLSAEWKRARGYRITEIGIEALHAAAVKGASLRLQTSAGEQAGEYEVLNHLALHAEEVVRETTLRYATAASKDLLQSLLRRRWIASEDLSETRNASRTVKVVVLKKPGTVQDHASADVSSLPESISDAQKLADASSTKADRNSTADSGRSRRAPSLNANQQRLLDALAAAGGRLALETVRDLAVPKTTLQTLVKRGLAEIIEEPAGFDVSRMHVRSALDFVFTPAQKAALERINAMVEAGRFSVALLHGVTGSGKTAVYLAAMQKLLGEGRGAIMLVPEIGLTPAAAAQLHQVFGEQVAILHSALTEDERAEQWHRIRRCEARIVVGTRSAVFAPIQDLALVVVDEEHDHSYKQEETPRYHARDVAVVRAKIAGAAVVLGSATPSLESYFNTQKGKYTLIELPDRVEQRPLPVVELVDMRQEFRETGHQLVISRRLGEEIAQRLERGEQAMVLLNRRGFSAFVICRACGETVQCRNCAIAMTYHKRVRTQPTAPAEPGVGPGKLECHYCGYQQRVPQACAKCGSDYVQFLGAGSEKLEELLHAQFPQARIGRLDRDTVRGRHDIERTLNAMEAGELDLLVGTQMIAKGHDLHGVTLVGVVGADAALAFPDFRAAERTFQLLTQVAGRAGRGVTPGKVVLQTYFPEHYAVQFAAHHDFNGFYDKELRYRGWMHYPPYNALANVLIRSDRLEEALKYAGTIGQWFRDTRHEGIRVLGPAAAPIVRLKSEYRYHLVLKSASREKLNATLRDMLAHASARKIPRVNLVVDVDAMSLL
jgi:primosomal protein N' (replication factor Y)